MIGIDIIDLKDPLLKSRDKALRFILHPQDQYPASEIVFWLLWTTKEAIFKAKREAKPFDPRLIQVTIYKSGDQLLFSSGEVAGKIKADQEKVLAIAEATTGTISYETCERKKDDPSAEIREVIKRYFQEKKSLEMNVTTDTKGLPMLDYRKIPISLSHHGRFLAFAYPDF